MLDGEDAQAGTPYNHAVIKMYACAALSQFGDRSSGIPIMIGLLSEKETQDLHGWIRSNLKQFTGQSFTEDQQWIDWWKGQAASTVPAAPRERFRDCQALPAAKLSQQNVYCA